MSEIGVDKQKSIYKLYNDGLGIRTVAKRVGCSPITARTYLRRAQIKIRTISEGMRLFRAAERTPLQIPTPIRHPITIELLGDNHSCDIRCRDCKRIFEESCPKYGRPYI